MPFLKHEGLKNRDAVLPPNNEHAYFDAEGVAEVSEETAFTTAGSVPGYYFFHRDPTTPPIVPIVPDDTAGAEENTPITSESKPGGKTAVKKAAKAVTDVPNGETDETTPAESETAGESATENTTSASAATTDAGGATATEDAESGSNPEAPASESDVPAAEGASLPEAGNSGEGV